MENKIINIDFDNMSEEELALIEEKSKEYRKKSLDRRVAELENWKVQVGFEVEDLKNKVITLKEDNTLLQKDNEELKAKVFVLRNDQDGKYNEFKKVCMARVHKIVGKKGSDKYILFFRSFSQKIYSDISR